ncbi:MAG: thiamine pyrophosphate-dependent dehydrogenase E1 component subunit alpha [Anaerolineales bacterium]|nr:thiamine pyrophosphate-dependent dehydrogenase E1 component subunit alpha [Anaerolineales bacterium]
MTTLSNDLKLEMYRRMVRIREFELTAMDVFKRGLIKGTVHPYIGEEASGVGVCMALRSDDLIAGTHRSHGHNIAKGADPARMMAEIFGKEAGYCRGRGGSMHITAFETGSLGALAVVGSGLPIAVGAALGFLMQGKDSVAVPFTGDGGTSTGNFHEALNMAAIWKLPVVFVVENNKYAVSTYYRDAVSIEDLSARAAGYGIPGVRVDGFDVLKVYAAAGEAVERARSGGGPTLLVTECYRIEGHYAGEPEVYRDRAEVNEQRQYDPIRRFAAVLTQDGTATAEQLEAIHQEIQAEMSAAVEFAQNAPMPDPSTALDYIYA